MTLSHAASAEQQEQCPNTEIAGNPPIYVPYPPGLIPPDLCSEVKRVQREVEVIFKEALAEWRALPPPTLSGQPPILQGTGYQAMELLGKLLNYDRNMSVGKRCGLQFLPYAIYRVHDTNPFYKFGSCCDAGIHALPVGQTEASVIHLLALLSPAPVQRSPKIFLRAEISGIRARPDTSWAVQMRSRRSIRRSILTSMAFPTPPASPTGSPTPSTGLSSSWFGARDH